MFLFSGLSTCHVNSQYESRKNSADTQIAQPINWPLNDDEIKLHYFLFILKNKHLKTLTIIQIKLLLQCMCMVFTFLLAIVYVGNNEYFVVN